MHTKHLIKEAIEKGVPIEDYIKSLDSSHRYYPLINRQLNRKNKNLEVMETETEIIERLVRQGSSDEELFNKYPEYIGHITRYRKYVIDNFDEADEAEI